MTIKRIFLAAAFLALGSSPVPAGAGVPASATIPAPTTAGCLLVSNLVARHGTTPKDRGVAQSSLYFFLGRIDERMTPQQLKSELERQGHAITKGNAVPLMNACLREMQGKSQMLQSAAQQLQQGK